MALHSEMDRLYVSMKEGIVFLFDVTQIEPIVLYTVELPYYALRINIDPTINLMQIMTTRGSLVCLQMSSKNPKLLEPTAFIESMHEESDESFKICTFSWISRGHRSNHMNGTYFEGSQKGKLWIRNIHMEHDKMMKIPTDFTDKIKQIHYCADKNIVFVSSKDGRFKCWKLPTQWDSNKMNEISEDFDF